MTNLKDDEATIRRVMDACREDYFDPDAIAPASYVMIWAIGAIVVGAGIAVWVLL